MTKPSRSLSQGREAFSGVVEAGRQRRRREAGDAERQIAASAPPATMTSASPSCDQPGGVADGVRAGGAGGDDRMVRALEAVADRDLARREVDQRAEG
jgi:hypothetical protein